MRRLSLTLLLLIGAPASAQDDAARGSLLVSASLAGAQVFIDYEDRGEAPLELSLEPGRYNVRVTMDNHDPFVRSVEVTSGGTAKVDAQLIAGVGTVEFVVTPKGAEVMIDDIPSGKAPIRLSTVSLGEHTYSLSANRYEPLEGSFTFEAGKNVLLVHELEEASGRISFETDPEGANILLDGEQVCVSPCTAEDVDPGVHHVRAELRGHATVIKTVDTTESFWGEFTTGLSDMHGSQVFKASTGDATWTINGQPMGEGKTLKTTLDRGSYRVVADAPGYRPVESTVVIGRDGREVWKAKLVDDTSDEMSSLEEGVPLVKNWIFWTAVGVGATGAGVGAAIALQPEEPEPLPSGDVVVSLP